MIQQKVLIDTDTLSAIMKQNAIVIPHAIAYLNQHQRFTFSLITRYEVLRGLKAKGATKQLRAFEAFCANNIIIPLTDEMIVKAADIYAILKNRGTPIGDADILIAATALILKIPVVTNNESHFCYIPELIVQNWLKE
jgi:tRNA(fMet)-specific endonuclease VapC